jgi:NAD(P)H-dependent FMN reductase
MPTASHVPLAPWPELPPLNDWQDTLETVHLWTQIVGKIRLEQAPWINHSWGSALYVTTRGLTTSPIPDETGTFAIDVDFVDHALRITTSPGEERSFALRPTSVAAFYDKTMRALSELGVEVDIFPKPVEIPDPIQPFPEDETHASYDADAVLIATPEYNHGVPAVTKNAVDWASHPPKNSPLNEKPVGIIGASPGMTGAARGQSQLRQALTFTNSVCMPQPELLVARAHEKFDEEGRLTDEKTRSYLRRYLGALTEWTARF